MAEFRGLMQHGHPRFETPRSALVAQAFLPVFFRGWAVAIFQLFHSSRGRSVSIQLDENLALLVIFGLVVRIAE